MWGPKAEQLHPGSLRTTLLLGAWGGRHCPAASAQGQMTLQWGKAGRRREGGGSRKHGLAWIMQAQGLGGPGVLGSMAKLVMMLRSRKSPGEPRNRGRPGQEQGDPRGEEPGFLKRGDGRNRVGGTESQCPGLPAACGLWWQGQRK